MKISSATPEELTLLATVVAVVALLVLLVDLSIKRAILSEAQALRAVINGYSGGSGEVGSGEAGGDIRVRGTDDAGDHGDYQPGLPADAEDASGGGIKSNIGLAEPRGRSYLNGDRTANRSSEVRNPVQTFPAEGYGIPEVQGGI